MITTGESAPSKGPGHSLDFIGLSPHGYHIDGLCHQFWDGQMYNGKPAYLVNAQQKATAGGIDKVYGGAVTRGVLLDIAQLKGKEWLDEGEAVFPEDLEAAEEAQGVWVEEGDALLVRLGWYWRRLRLGPPTPPARPGLQAACLPWVHGRGISVLGADASHDVEPTAILKVALPYAA